MFCRLTSDNTEFQVLATENWDFDEYEIEDIYVGGCDPGSISNTDYTCSRCTPGTFANTEAEPQSCDLCPYDTYSGDGAAVCTVCSQGLGTLEKGSTAASDCIGMLQPMFQLAVNHMLL